MMKIDKGLTVKPEADGSVLRQSREDISLAPASLEI